MISEIESFLGGMAEQIAAKLAPQMQRAVESAVQRALADVAESALEPLDKILGVSVAAARMRLNRDPELRALGLPVGRRLFFRRAEVNALLATRARSGR
jgi:hypothetical protein